MMLDFISVNPMETQMVIQMVIAALMGAVIGYERERYNRPAGLRTHVLVTIGACVFTMLSMNALPEGADAGRMAAYVIVGIGFIGAGTVIQLKDKIVGLTTAASLWMTAAIGVSVGMGYYLLALSTVVLGFIVLCMKSMERSITKTKPRRKK